MAPGKKGGNMFSAEKKTGSGKKRENNQRARRRRSAEDLVQSFHDLFGQKIAATKQFAQKATEQYGFLAHLLRDA